MRQTRKRDEWSKSLPVRTFFPTGMSHCPSQVWTMFDFLRGGVVCDPAFSYNLGAGPPGSGARSVSVIGSSFGPLPPPLPTARSVTVAQIMSPPGSINPYASSLLSGLKKYFLSSLRLVKRGDVLVIPTEIDPLTIHIATTLGEITHISDGNL